MARATIRQMRERGYRVLFQCNYDGTICVTAISPSKQAYIVRGRICDDARAIAELGRMVGVVNAPAKPRLSMRGCEGQQVSE